MLRKSPARKRKTKVNLAPGTNFSKSPTILPSNAESDKSKSPDRRKTLKKLSLVSLHTTTEELTTPAKVPTVARGSSKLSVNDSEHEGRSSALKHSTVPQSEQNTDGQTIRLQTIEEGQSKNAHQRKRTI